MLPGFLSSLPAGLEGIRDARVTLVDNGSTDSGVELVRSLAPTAQVVQLGRNAGYAAGINAALETVGPGRHVLVCNPDVRLRRGCVAALCDTLSNDHRVGIAAPRIEAPDGRLERSLRRDPTVLRALGEAILGGTRAGRYSALGEVVMHPGSYDSTADFDWVSGAVLLLSSECIATVGTWDDSFFLYSEETDYAIRARRAGYVVRYQPSARAVHVGGQAHASPELWSLLTLNRARLFARYHGQLRARAFWAALVLNEGLRAAGDDVHRAGLKELLRSRSEFLGGTPS